MNRKDRRKLKSEGRNLTVAGKKMVNPPGKCYDIAKEIFLNGDDDLPNAIMVHGIGISNWPGQVGNTISHAWIEFDHPEHGRLALDPIWMVAQGFEHFRANMQMSYCVEYTRQEYEDLCRFHRRSGPFDKRVCAVAPVSQPPIRKEKLQ